MKLITLQNLSTFADEIKSRYAKAADLTAVSDRVKALEDVGAQANVLEAVKVNGTEEQVTATINARVSSTYKAGGSVAFADLPELKEENLGLVVNVTEKFTTTADFVEGADSKHPAGTNVAVVKVGEDYKYDVLAGFVDLSGYIKTSEIETITSAEVTALLADSAEGQV